jgi:hypothetical protein
MTFAQIPAGEPVFLDANTLIYHFGNDSSFGAACSDFDLSLVRASQSFVLHSRLAAAGSARTVVGLLQLRR